MTDIPTNQTEHHGTCHVCARDFQIRFRYQVREEAGGYLYICSQRCQQALLAGGRDDADACACDVCGRDFVLEYPHQVAVRDGARQYFCSTECRESGASVVAPTPQVHRKIAVFNHKGGTGKTTTSVNLAAGLAEAGQRVLLIDADGQGNVGASLGIRGERTLYHVLVQGLDPAEAAVPVRQGLDVLTSDESLAAAELHLTTRPGRDRVLRERLGRLTDRYDVVVLDCAPALSLMNQNALVYADSVLVPVSCDYLSLVGVKQVLKTLRNVRDLLDHDVHIMGVLPTFYDTRNRISRDAISALRKHFGERCLPPVRVNTRLREAPTAKQSIFEYDPDSNGAKDYAAVVRAVLAETRPVRQPSEHGLPAPVVGVPVPVPPPAPQTSPAHA